MVVQKTSLPEDIEALKTFHAAYLRIEEELTIERGKREQLARDLAAKDAVDKVFMGKEFRKVVESAT